MTRHLLSESGSDSNRYFAAAQRPLTILLFLLPLVIAYELCLALVLPEGDGLHVHTVEAHRGLLWFFGLFGIAPAGGLYLGGVLIVVILLVWHVLVRERWHVDPIVIPLMAVESLVLALPLLVVSHLIATGPLAGIPVFAELDLWSQMAISVGAGLYEELVFRMILLAVMHTLLVDVAKVPDWVGATIAIVLAAAAFAWYHQPGGGVTLPRRALVFYFVAGLYFGTIYMLRGFGLVVGAHASYDVITALLSDGD